MRKKLQFKQTEIGVIPEEWDIRIFSDVLLGKTRNGIYKSRNFHGRGVKMINMGELFAYDKIYDAEMELVELTDSEKERFLVKNGDLLFARRSLVAEGAGKCSLVVGDIERTFESSIIQARPDHQKAHPEYLFYFFSSPVGKHLLDSILRQVAVAGITGSDLMKLKIPIPSLPEQHNIGKILSDFDSKIVSNQMMNRTLEAIGQAVFRRWFVDFEFPNEEGKPYKSTGGKMKYSKELEMEIPAIFQVGTIYDLCDVIYGFPFSSRYFNRNQSGKPLIRIRDLKTLSPEFFTTESDARMTVVNPGDVIAGMDAEFRPWIWLGEESYLNQRLCMFKPKKEKKVHEFLIYQIVGPLLRKEEQAKVGTTVIHLAKSDIDRWKVIIPDHKTLSLFSNLITSIFERLIVNSKENRYLTQIRDLLLPKLMSGKIRVPIEKETVEAT